MKPILDIFLHIYLLFENRLNLKEFVLEIQVQNERVPNEIEGFNFSEMELKDVNRSEKFGKVSFDKVLS